MPKGNPQLEDGYTPIANELLEGIMLSDVSRQQLLILLAIIRQTYGWKRKEAEISLSLFQKLTGIDRRHVQRALTEMLNRGLLERYPAGKMKFGKPVYKYVINKKSWCLYGTRTGANREPVTGANRALIKTRNKILNNKRVEIVDKLSMPK